jgi:hypothetical protein
MDPVRCRPGSFVSERLLTAGGEMAGTSPRGRAPTSTAEDLDRRRDDRRHAIAMKRTDPRSPPTDDHSQRGSTMSYYGYMFYEAERTKSPAEQRAADALLGQNSAALARLFRSLARPARALRRQPGTSLPARRACLPADSGS